ncbi:IclR family transcriptional regulator [Streptomyces sp. SBT349]|uniref:IclR family transcriptional regulator n=1 Tax=Streptomyces sp. SBT349 TaxID=1580539 RepID=UPI000ACEE280|nr:IclR family transcriptional regulator [Streptomyces sp. SBT349]
MVATPGGVRTIVRAGEVMELLADARDGMTAGALATAAGLPLPTVHRLLRTLVAGGHARQGPGRRYWPGPRWIRLGAVAGRALGATAQPFLARMVEATGETANLALLEGDVVVYLAQAPSRHSVRMFTEIGRRVHPHCTGVGKALLAGMEDERVREIVARAGMEPMTDRTLTDLPALLADLASVRARGWATDDGEQEVGVRCLAVRVPHATLPVALSVSGPEGRVTHEAIARHGPVLAKIASSYARALADGRAAR